MLFKTCHQDTFGVFLNKWNETQNYTTPFLHYRIATWLQTCWERGETRLLLQAFRASGKSTLVALFSAWLLCRDPDLRILVLSAESRLSSKMTRMIRKIVEKHPLTKKLRPNNPEEWAADRFTVVRQRASRDPSVLSCGLYSNITGARADVIICDDVEVPNTCNSADKRAKLRERLGENEFILVPNGTQLYIGTPHSYYTIYADAPREETGEKKVFLQDYERQYYPIVDEDDESAWPERYDADAIEDMRIQSGPMKFLSQMMLQPVSITEGRLDPDLFREYGREIFYQEVQKQAVLSICDKRMASASAWWDPAFGGKGGDASVLAIVYTDEDGGRWLHRVSYIRVWVGDDEDEATKQCALVAEIARKFHLPFVAVETNGIGKFLPAMLRRIMGEMKISCSVRDIHNTQNKDERILEAFDAVMAARALHVHKTVYDTPFIREVQEWRPGVKGQRDDGLDAVAGALSLDPMRVRRHYTDFGKPSWTIGGKAHTARTEFEV